MECPRFRVDLSKVGKQPLVDWLTPEEPSRLLYNPVAGGQIAQTKRVVFDVLSRASVPIGAGKDPDQFLYVAGWGPDGKELWFYRMTRDFRRLDLMAADPLTGSSRVVLTETSKTFINGYEGGWDAEPGSAVWVARTFTPLWDRRQFLWLSEQDGWRHIYLRGGDGTLVRRLTSGSFPVHRIVAVDSKAGWVYFTASDDPKIERRPRR